MRSDDVELADDDEPVTLEGATVLELAHLWSDLHYAVQTAINGQWSISCDGLAARIKTLTRFVGPTPWEEIQIPLLESGVYQRLHAEAGVEAPVPMDQVAKTRAAINQRARSRA